MNMHSFFASCPKLLEGLLKQELELLGAQETRETVTGVYFKADLSTAYRICLWSRLANHILLTLKVLPANNLEELQAGLNNMPWLLHFDASQTFKIDFSGQSQWIRNTQYGAQCVKDAIVDYFREHAGERPQVDTLNPDIRFHAHLFGDSLTLSLDLSGESLHRRGYRDQGGDAPLKENVASALLIRAGFDKKYAEYRYVVDPCAGSGTLLIEAVLMAADIAPGLFRKRFGFEAWKQHEPMLWQKLRKDAEKRRSEGLSKQLPDFRGYDASPRAVSIARENIEAAGLTQHIEVLVRSLSDLTPPTHHGRARGLLITNPPYGERLSEKEVLIPLYQHLGERLKSEFLGWDVGILTTDPALSAALRLRSDKQYAVFNGTLACRWLLFRIAPAEFAYEKPAEKSVAKAEVVFEGPALMLANRLKKNLNHLKNWVKKNNIECYRLYDADLPEFAVAIDCYKNWVHIQEYAAPKSIEPEKAAARLEIIKKVVPQVLGIPENHVVMKLREKQKKFGQYQKMAQTQDFIKVREGNCDLWVNLRDYLDTGLFLDHRPMRMLLEKEAQGKRFLNLFCYTAVATLHAARGGARRTVSVDLSNTYTQWAKRNLALNGFSEPLHQVVQADCLQWLQENQETFDIIFLDPPTFSRSKKMDDHFDVQTDHVFMIKLAMKHLSLGGVLYFSNNFKKFVLDKEALADFHIEDITARTIDKDFERDKKVHQCFKITRV